MPTAGGDMDLQVLPRQKVVSAVQYLYKADKVPISETLTDTNYYSV